MILEFYLEKEEHEDSNQFFVSLEVRAVYDYWFVFKLPAIDLPAVLLHSMSVLQTQAMLLSLTIVLPSRVSHQQFTHRAHFLCYWNGSRVISEPIASHVYEYSHQYYGSGDCTQVAFSPLVGVAVGQMEKGAVSAFHKAAEGRVDESPQRVTEAQQKCHLTVPTWMCSKVWNLHFVVLVHAVWKRLNLYNCYLPTFSYVNLTFSILIGRKFMMTHFLLY